MSEPQKATVEDYGNEISRILQFYKKRKQVLIINSLMAIDNVKDNAERFKQAEIVDRICEVIEDILSMFPSEKDQKM